MHGVDGRETSRAFDTLGAGVDGMIAKIAKFVGYRKAPKATFMALHPVKGTTALVAAKGMKGLVTTRSGAVLGAMVAAPVGVWALMRRRNNRR
jgi:hypothetical protein